MSTDQIDKTTTKCGHLEALAENGFIRFGILMNLQQGTQRLGPIIDQLIEGRDGMLRRTTKSTWMELLHCPLCGEQTDVALATAEEE